MERQRRIFPNVFQVRAYHNMVAWNMEGNFQAGSGGKPLSPMDPVQTDLICPLPIFDTVLPGFGDLFYTVTIQKNPKPPP